MKKPISRILISRTLELAKALRARINSTEAFRVLELSDLLPDEIKQDNIQLNSTKVTVDISRCGFTIGAARSKVSRLYDAMMRIARENRAPQRLYRTAEIPRFTELKYLPRDTLYCGGKLMPLLDEQDKINSNLNGRVSTDQIAPYPPGIPVLVPGQMITQGIIQYLISRLPSQKREKFTESFMTIICPAWDY